MQYILILYSYETDKILVIPIKIIGDADMLRSCDVINEILKNMGQASQLNIMDNEAYTSLKRLYTKSRALVQLDPPHTHRRDEKKMIMRQSFGSDLFSDVFSEIGE